MQVIITPKALKDYNHLPQSEQVKVKKKLRLLDHDPLVGKKLSGALEELRSIRAWPYRIIYYIDNLKEKVFITAILHRQGVYK